MQGFSKFVFRSVIDTTKHFFHLLATTLDPLAHFLFAMLVHFIESSTLFIAFCFRMLVSDGGVSIVGGFGMVFWLNIKFIVGLLIGFVGEFGRWQVGS